MAYSHTAGYLRMIRARIVRDAARGYSNARIAVGCGSFAVKV